jgi:hypothetical protein
MRTDAPPPNHAQRRIREAARHLRAQLKLILALLLLLLPTRQFGGLCFQPAIQGIQQIPGTPAFP